MLKTKPPLSNTRKRITYCIEFQLLHFVRIIMRDVQVHNPTSTVYYTKKHEDEKAS